MPEFIVIGAGISGLTVAHQLARAGKDVLVVEQAENVGGKILTERVEGYLLEAGPNSLRIENTETLDLLEDLALTSRIMEANLSSKKRYILKNGKCIKVPHSLGEAATSSLISIQSKLRLLREPFIPRSNSEDESVAEFVARRLGKEILEYVADPFINGIYAGDPELLSMRYSFPSLWKAEQDHGSLIKGMMKERKGHPKDRIKSRAASFPEGLSELTDVIRSTIGERLLLHTGVLRINRSAHGYVISTSSGDFRAPKIICALPAYDVSALIEPLAPELAHALLRIDYPPVAVIYLGYRKDQFVKAPEGFGVLIPSLERRKILGAIFSSSNFLNRAPEGHLLLTVLTGGARHSEIAAWSNEKILETATTEINHLLKPQGAPAFQHIRLWKRAIPQYKVGYGTILDTIGRVEAANPGLHFIGNYRDGISMGACIRNATELAKRLV